VLINERIGLFLALTMFQNIVSAKNGFKFGGNYIFSYLSAKFANIDMTHLKNVPLNISALTILMRLKKAWVLAEFTPKYLPGEVKTVKKARKLTA
jgi:hypothetical protein